MVDNYYQASRHNLSILDDSTGDTLGFVCSLDENRVPIYAELDAQRLVDLFSQSPTQISTDPMKELILGAETHHAGFGQEYQDDPKKYFQSFGMDLSVKGQAMTGWSSTGIAPPSGISVAGTITNGGMELSANWTNGSRSNTQAHGGTYSWNVGTPVTAFQEAVTWDNSWQGKVFLFGCWVWASDASRGRIAINDGVGNTTSGFHTGSSSWEWFSIIRTLDGSATKVQLELQNTAGSGSVVFFDDAVIGTPVTGIVPAYGHATFNSEEYLASGNMLVKLNGSGDGWTIVASFPAAITSLVPFQVSGTDYLFIFIGTSNSYWYMTTAEAFNESTLTVKTFQFGAWVNTTVDTMYANDGDNTVRATVNPLNGGTQWSGQTVVGEAAIPITLLEDKDGALLIDKEDRPYYLDSSGNVQKDLAPEADSGKSTHSGKNSTIWQGVYYRPTGDQALLSSGKYADGTIGKNDWVQPARYTSNNSEFVGQVEAVVGDEEWLYLAADNYKKVEVFYDGNDTGQTGAYGVTWWSQTFTTDSSFTVSGIKLKTYRVGSPGTVTVSIRTSSGGKPTGADLTSGTFDGDTVTEDTDGEWTSVSVTGYSLSASTVYAIVYRATAGDGSNIIYAKSDAASGYTGGFRTFSTDSGSVWATPGDTDILFSVYSSEAMIFKGRPEVIDGQTVQVWHPFHELTIAGIETMWISTVYKKRLWFSSTTASENIFYLPLPTKYGDITQDDERIFKTNTYFITSGLHGGFRSDPKQLIKVDATLGHDYDVDIYFECWYKVLGGSFVDLGDLKGTTTNRTATLYRSVATTAPIFFFKFVAKTDDTTKTPLLVDFKAKTLLFAEDKQIIYTKVRVGRGVSDKNGTSFSDKYELQKTLMDNMRAATNHITMTDLDGNTKFVRMLTLPESPDSAWRKPIRSVKGEVIEWEYTLLLLEIKLS